MFEYGMLLSGYLQTHIYSEVAEHTEGMDPIVLEGRYPEIADSLIQKLPFIDPLKEYFRAANINYWVRMEGISPQLQKLGEEFYKEVN